MAQGMRATLVHNPKAGTAEDETWLRREFEKIGWTIHQCLAKRELARCVDEPGEAVIVAGGDGTIAKVARLLAGSEVPMVVIPTGTANNIARSLGVGIDCRALVAGLAETGERCIDVGTVESDSGEEIFLEGFGMGFFAYAVGERSAKKHKKLKKLKHAFDLLANTLEKYEPREFTITVDDKDLSGDYLLAAVLNLRSFGPALALAPHAKIDDGELDVVLVRPEARDMLVANLRRAIDEGNLALPEFETHRATRVHVRADGRWAHVDDLPRELDGDVDIAIRPGAVRVLVPMITVTAPTESRIENV